MTSPTRCLTHIPLRAGLLALLGTGLLAAAAPAQLGAAGETKQFAAQITVELLTLKGALKTDESSFETDFKAIKDAVTANTTAPDLAHEQIFNRLDQFFADEDADLKTFVGTIEGDASTHLQNMVVFPNAFVVGDAGLIDKAVHDAADLVHVNTVKAYVKVNAFSKKLQKNTHYDLVVDRRPQLVDPITPSDHNGTPSPTPKTTLRIDILLAGSDHTVVGDGRICLAGTADPANGANIAVTLTKPGDAPIVINTTVDAGTHRWKILSPAALPGTLPEGDYAVDVTQGGVTVSDSIGAQ